MPYVFLTPIILGFPRAQRNLGFNHMGKKTPSHDLETLIIKAPNGPLGTQ